MQSMLTFETDYAFVKYLNMVLYCKQFGLTV